MPAPPTRRRAARRTTISILLVEPYPQAQASLRSFLVGLQAGVVHVAEGGEDALALLRRDPEIQVVVTEWALPSARLDGLALCREARLLPRTRYLYFVLLTDAPQRAHMADALQQGVDAFLVKPVEVVELEAHLKVAQRIHNLEDELASRMQERKRFYRDVLAAVSRQRLHLVEADEIPAFGECRDAQDLETADDVTPVRQRLRRIAQESGLSKEMQENLVTAAGEAMTNALRHARKPHCEIWASPGCVAVRVRDEGDGIPASILPFCVLIPGWSTRESMGAGFEMMLNLADAVWLATGPHGTTIQVAVKQEPAVAVCNFEGRAEVT